MELHTNTVRKQRTLKKSKIINLKKQRYAKYLYFKSQVIFFSLIFLGMCLIVSGIVYFLVGQVHLTVLTEKISKNNNTRNYDKFNSKLEKKQKNNNIRKYFKLEDKVEIF